MIHPTNEEWMSFLYGETPAARTAELEQHARACPSCREQLDAWRSTLATLDTAPLPAVVKPRRRLPAGFARLTAAAAVLVIGFFVGRLSQGQSRELAELKASVAELSAQVRSQSDAVASNSVMAATTAVSEDTARQLLAFSQKIAQQQLESQRGVYAALQTLDYRLVRLGNGLATVAVSTKDGFEKTQENILALASTSTQEPVNSPTDRSLQ